MSGQKIVIASDHAGFDFKASLKNSLTGQGYEVIDLGTHGPESVDLSRHRGGPRGRHPGRQAERGVLICGTGIGISIAANRHPGIRAALCHDTTGARLSRQHNDANVLVLGARVTGIETALDCLRPSCPRRSKAAVTAAALTRWAEPPISNSKSPVFHDLPALRYFRASGSPIAGDADGAARKTPETVINALKRLHK